MIKALLADILYLSGMVLRSIILFVLFVNVLTAKAQLPVTDQQLQQRYPFLRSVFNRIPVYPALDSFYEKLWQLKQTHNGQVSVVFIGDSHTQPGYQAASLRQALQTYFGNSGRGLVFPYQLAQSNSPDDIRSNTTGGYWLFNRLAHPEIDLPYGLSGFGITSNLDFAGVQVQLREPGAGNQLQLFTDSLYQNQWSYIAGADTLSLLRDTLYPWKTIPQSISNESGSFIITGSGSNTRKSLYGVAVTSTDPGVVVHNIGVNGARYDHFNNASLFWQQLPSLQADLYIVSLGTNEAQARTFSEPAFRQQVSLFLQKLKTISPQAAVILCTAPDSYKGRYSNKVLQQLNQSLTRYCTEQRLPLWDLYRITGGYGSAASWQRRRMMNRDRIHYTAEGYRIMGNLLLSALARSYNSFAEDRK